MKRLLMLTALLAWAPLPPAYGGPVETTALAFESEEIDLDTGTVSEVDWAVPVNAEADFRFGYHADRTPHAVMVPNLAAGVEIAFLDATPFASITYADLPALTFTQDLPDEPFDGTDTALLRTGTGAYFKVGKVLEEATYVLFDYQRLEEPAAALGSPTSGAGPGAVSLPQPPADLSLAEWTEVRSPIGLAEDRISEVHARQANDPVTAHPWIQDAKLLASDGAAEEFFGSRVALSGDRALVGAFGDDDQGPRSGSAYVFRRGATGWVEEAKLLASDGAFWDYFGYSVALSGDTALVGAPRNDDRGTESGSAYVFRRGAGGWVEEAKLLPSDGAWWDMFGVSVALAGDTAVVGAQHDDDRGYNSGSAYVFRRGPGGWVEETKLLASDGTAWDLFGRSVALSGDTALAGAYADATFSGSAYVFRRGAGGWLEEAKLLASDGSAWDHFGLSVALSGDTALIGAYGDRDQGSATGSAYAFRCGAGGWVEEAKLLASDGAAGDWFGIAVAVAGDAALIGAPYDQDLGSESGSAYVFRRGAGGWAEEVKLLAGDGAIGDLFGRSVALAGNSALVGAGGDDDQGSRSGSVYVFSPANQPPICRAAAPGSVECQGVRTTVPLDGSASSDPDDDPLTFAWATDCPGGSFDDPTSPTPILTVDSAVSGVCAPLSCTAALTVTELIPPGETPPEEPPPEEPPPEEPPSDAGGASDSCSTAVTVEDTLAPMVAVDTAPITVVDADCSGAEAVGLPAATASDRCDPVPSLGHDAPATFPAGATTRVTYTAADACGNAGRSEVDVTVLYGADIAVRAEKHTVGAGTYPGSSKEPLVGIEVCAYDKAEGSCARVTCSGISHQHYRCIVDTCTPVNCCTTDGDGECTLNAPPGDYVVISDDATKAVLPDPLGVSASDLVCGERKQKHLQQIVRADGKKLPGKTTRRTGSELLIIEPDFVEWDETQEPYPVVFEAVGDWNADSSVTPPEGFVSDYDSLSEQVTDEVEAVQFVLTDVGSDWVPTETTHRLRHQGRREVVLSRIGVRLAWGLARAKGLDRDGHPLGSDGKPMPPAGFDPRGEWPVEIAGWIEPSAADPLWTIELRVERASDLTLTITRGQGRVVETLAGGSFAPGEYAFRWDAAALGPGQYFLVLTAGELTQKKKLAELME